ncbi:MAG: SDR family oxidoreductase [Paenibacillaceae bacterium]|nr:SDR family oxidoreductase [Paenibacillaceae bacterium]
MGRVQDRIAVVTGAGSGIGEAIASLLVSEGAEVVLLGRNEQRLKEAQQRIGGRTHVFAADISREADASAVGAFLEQRFGKADILVNNAGTVKRNENMLETTEDEWTSFMQINLLGPFLMSQAILPFMIRQGKGAIVNLASQLGVIAAPGYATYATAKGGIVSFTKSLAIDYGAYGIRANCVSPGLVETPMAYVGRDNFDAVKQSIADAHPLKRIGTPMDIAYAVLYLASDEAGWVTGTNLLVDGGFTAK